MANRLAIFLLCFVALLAGPATAAQADTATQLPFPNGNQAWLAVDPSGGHVFVSAGPGSSSIAVLDYAGKLVKTISGEAGASQMALDSATHTLYVALHDASAISEINTQTLGETTRFSTAPYPDPLSLVIAGGKLWFSCANGNSGCLVSASLNGSGMATPISGVAFPLFLAAGGSNNHLLAFGYSEDEPPNLYVYDVSGAAPSLVSKAFDPNSSSDVSDMTFDPSGANLLLATGAPYFIQSLATSTLLPSGQYPTGPYPLAIATTADGKYVAGGINPSTGNADVLVYPAGSTRPVRTWNIGTGVPALLAHGLAFSPDSSRLFAVAKGSTNHLELYVLAKPTAHLLRTSTSLARSNAVVTYGSRTKLTAHVKGTKRGKVGLYAAPVGGTQKLVGTASLRSGKVTFTVKPTRNTTYSAALAQDSNYASSTSRGVRIAVRPVITVAAHTLRSPVVQNGVRLVKTNLIGRTRPPRPYVVCTCGTHGETETMGFVVQRRLNGVAWHTVLNLSAATIGRGGIKHAWFTTNEPGQYRVRAVYSGDSEYLPSESAWRTVQIGAIG